MNHPWLALFAFYLAVGAFVCTFARDKHGNSMPLHHFLLIVAFWPMLFILPHDGD